jgi:hypothetical protein
MLSGTRTLEGPVASILQFVRVDRSLFDDFVAGVMGEAFDAACAELQDNNLSELVREIIAERIVEAAKRGERDPQRLCSFAIAAMNGERNRITAPRWGR